MCSLVVADLCMMGWLCVGVLFDVWCVLFVVLCLLVAVCCLLFVVS